ncbi:uncharacterized protein LOC110730766 [Chenopodium quinoa]|uniref:uncharacterized protein LOC110730766 n=1 Tax=Chenopodium quinoa TaxID=63459 RepID=UPI000B77C029|nr:uncharacterized protein LOC110730766 [Chenopodium quinoa]
MRRSLLAKRKFGFVDGTIVMPKTDAKKMEDWIVVQSMLVSWITNTLDSKTALGACQQSSTESVADYFGRLSKIWKELLNYVRVPKCGCGKCECNIVTQVESIREEDYLDYFLIGLDAHYAAIRAQLLAQSPLPSVDVAYQNVAMAERLRDGSMKVENAVAFKVDKAKPKYEDNSDKFCNHCNRIGHDESGCFQIIGYPEWWGDRGRGGRGRGRSGGCGGRGGARNSGSNSASTSSQQQSVRANKVGGSSQQQSQAPLTDDAAASLVGVSATQVQQILDILKNNKFHGKTNKIPWIVDTGASNHVSCDLTLFKNVKKIQNCPAGLLDGNSANADQLGTVILPGGLQLENMLYVPQLTCNLISVTQLNDESKCMMQFTNKICVIQDPQTRKVIGVGEREDGLYIFRGVPQVKVLAVEGDSSFDLWHQRLGHPSDSVLRNIPHVSSSSRKNNKFVMFVLVQNNLGVVFQLVKIKQVVYLNLCILIYGVRIKYQPHVVPVIF